jgi:hypothetical protein
MKLPREVIVLLWKLLDFRTDKVKPVKKLRQKVMSLNYFFSFTLGVLREGEIFPFHLPPEGCTLFRKGGRSR